MMRMMRKLLALKQEPFPSRAVLRGLMSSSEKSRHSPMGGTTIKSTRYRKV